MSEPSLLPVTYCLNDENETIVRRGVVDHLPNRGDYVHWRGHHGFWKVLFVVHSYSEGAPENDHLPMIYVYVKHCRKLK